MSRCLALIDGGNLSMRFASVMADVHAPLEADFPRIAGAVHSCIRDFCSVVQATHLIVAFDSPAPGWRHDIFPAYKAARTVDTAPWQDAVAAHLRSYRVRCVRVEGFEADDVIGTIAARTRGRTCLLSSDSDLLSLLRDEPMLSTVEPWRFGREPEPYFVRVTREAVVERYGVQPELLPDYKAIVGETGDGVPGVKGYGPVAARRLLEMYRSLDAVASAAEEGVREGFRRPWTPEECAWVRTARKLVSVSTDAPVPAILPGECAL